MQKITKKWLAFLITLAIILCSIPSTANAAAKPKLNRAKRTLYVGDTFKLNVKNKPADATYKWKSNKPKIAKVGKKGKVTARNEGTAKITCTVTTQDDTYKLTSKIIVIEEEEEEEETTPAPTATPVPTPTPTPAPVAKTLTSSDITNGSITLTNVNYDVVTLDSTVGTTKVIIGSNAKVKTLEATNSLTLEQQTGGTLSTINLKGGSTSSQTYNLTGYSGDINYSSANTASATISLNNSKVNTFRINEAASGQTLKIMDANSSAVSKITKFSVNSLANIELNVACDNVEVESTCTGANLTLKSTITSLTNAGTSSNITWSGNLSNITNSGTRANFKMNVTSTTPVNTFTNSGADCSLTLGTPARITTLNSTAERFNATLNSYSSISNTTISGNNSTLKGEGTATEVTLNASYCSIHISGAKVTVGSGYTGNIGNNTNLEAGRTTYVPNRVYSYKDLGYINATYNATTGVLTMTIPNLSSFGQINPAKIKIGSQSLEGNCSITGNTVTIVLTNAASVNSANYFSGNNVLPSGLILEQGAFADSTGNTINNALTTSLSVQGFSTSSTTPTAVCNITSDSSGTLTITFNNSIAFTDKIVNSYITLGNISLQGNTMTSSIGSVTIYLTPQQIASIRQLGTTTTLYIPVNAFTNTSGYTIQATNLTVFLSNSNSNTSNVTIYAPSNTITASYGSSTTTATGTLYPSTGTSSQITGSYSGTYGNYNYSIYFSGTTYTATITTINNTTFTGSNALTIVVPRTSIWINGVNPTSDLTLSITINIS